MSWPDTFERMLASLHEAAFDEAQWPAASALIEQTCGFRGSVIISGIGESRDDIDVFFARVCVGGQRQVECEREYFEVYHAFDERLPRLRQLPDSQVVPTGSLLSEEEMKNSLVYNEQVKPAGFGNALYARLDGPGGSRIVWTVGDPVDGDGWSAKSIEMVQRILPHLRQFVRVRQALASANALGATLGNLLVNMRANVIQLDQRGRVLNANDGARAILRRGDGLISRDGSLHASVSVEDAELQKALARALPPSGGAGESGSVMVSREQSMTRLVVHVSPVHRGAAQAGAGQVCVLVLVIDPEGRWRIDANRLGTILGLTPAESLVAMMLAEGKTIRDIAKATVRRETTVKWHVRHIFDKVGVSRQADLVRLVLSVADIPKARR